MNAMRVLLSLLALTSIASATGLDFYPKATGQGDAISTNKDSAHFSVTCGKYPPEDYKKSFRGGIKVVVKTPSGLVRTINMPEVDDASFFYTQCTMQGPGTLEVDYGKGKVSKYEGVVRAVLADRTTDGHGRGQSDAIDISFQSKNLKVPQAQFQGKVTAGHILVTHPPIAIPKPQGHTKPNAGSNNPPPAR